MNCLLVFVFLSAPVLAYDGIVWSTENTDLTNFHLSKGIAKSDVNHPIVLILLEQFSLSDFNRFAGVYRQTKSDVVERPLLRSLRAAGNYGCFSYKIDEELSLTNKNLNVFRVEDLKDLDGQLTTILKGLSKSYTVVVLSSQAIEHLHQSKRAKREAEMEPLVLAAAVNGSDCALSIDQVMVTVHKKGAADATYCLYYDNTTDPSSAPYMRSCNEISTCGSNCDPSTTQLYKSTFQMRFINGELCDPFPDAQSGVTISEVTLQLTFDAIMDQQWWRLGDVTVIDIKATGFTVPNMVMNGVTDAYITTIYYNAWTCPLTDPVHSENADTTVAFQFMNFVAQPFGWMNTGNGNADNTTIPYTTAPNAENSRRVDSCVPMMSIGDYMAFFIIGIMLIFLFFIINLLNDLKTNDRYDDPKQKPLVITVKGE